MERRKTRLGSRADLDQSPVTYLKDYGEFLVRTFILRECLLNVIRKPVEFLVECALKGNTRGVVDFVSMLMGSEAPCVGTLFQDLQRVRVSITASICFPLNVLISQNQ